MNGLCFTAHYLFTQQACIENHFEDSNSYWRNKVCVNNSILDDFWWIIYINISIVDGVKVLRLLVAFIESMRFRFYL